MLLFLVVCYCRFVIVARMNVVKAANAVVISGDLERRICRLGEGSQKIARDAIIEQGVAEGSRVVGELERFQEKDVVSELLSMFIPIECRRAEGPAEE